MINIQVATKNIHAVHKSVQMKKRTETDPVWNHQKTMTKTEPISLMHLQRTSKARILFTKKQLMIKIIKERDLTVGNWQKTADKGIGKVETNQLPRIIAKAIKRHSANGANTIERRAFTKKTKSQKQSILKQRHWPIKELIQKQWHQCKVPQAPLSLNPVQPHHQSKGKL